MTHMINKRLHHNHEERVKIKREEEGRRRREIGKGVSERREEMLLKWLIFHSKGYISMKIIEMFLVMKLTRSHLRAFGLEKRYIRTSYYYYLL